MDSDAFTKAHQEALEEFRRKQEEKQLLGNSSKQSIPAPPKREPLPVAERPVRKSRHSRTAAVASLPSTEDLGHIPELENDLGFWQAFGQAQPSQSPSRPSSTEFLLSRLTALSSTPPSSTTPPGSPSTPKAGQTNTTPSSRSENNENMNYQGFADPNQGGQPSNSRGPPPPSPGQNMAHANGMNGQMGMAGMGGMIGFPTPAGHQSDLNYIMQMVEELSRLLAANQQITNNILEKIGNVRQRAKDQNLSNEELLALVSEELNTSSENLEKENSALLRALQSSKADAEENWKLVLHAAGILEDIKEKTHAYKYQHEKDTLAWHKSYREQLAAERKENQELRCHIADMQAHAAKANDYINQLRRYASEHKIINNLTIEVHQYKSERRYWKRMACPGLIDDPSEWSDDEGGATGDIPEEEKKACAPYIEERMEMMRILNNKDS